MTVSAADPGQAPSDSSGVGPSGVRRWGAEQPRLQARESASASARPRGRIEASGLRMSAPWSRETLGAVKFQVKCGRALPVTGKEMSSERRRTWSRSSRARRRTWRFP